MKGVGCSELGNKLFFLNTLYLDSTYGVFVCLSIPNVTLQHY